MNSDDGEGFAIDFDPGNALGFNRSANPMLDPMVLHAYLASPLTNLDEPVKIENEAVRACIRTLFGRYEFQGVQFQVYDPGEVTPPGTKHTDDEVYVMDHHQTSQADFVIFLVLAPSLGVGMEAQIAADCNLPRLVVSKKGTAISRMFRGLFCPTIAWIEYENVADAREQVGRQLPVIASAAVKSAIGRRAQVREFCAEQIGVQVLKSRLVQGISLPQLAEMTDIREGWLQRLEWDPCLAAGLTLIQFHRIANVLRAKASISTTGLPTLRAGQSQPELTRRQLDSLETLVEFVQQGRQSIDDTRVVAIWRDYILQGVGTLQGVAQEPDPDEFTVTVEEWRGRYESEMIEEPVRQTSGSRQEGVESRQDATSEPNDEQRPASHGTLPEEAKPISPRMGLCDRQRFLPGIGEQTQVNTTASDDPDAAQTQAALSILAAARHGLPPYAVAGALGVSPEELEAKLSFHFSEGILKSRDGIWHSADGHEAICPPQAGDVVARCLACLLTCLEYDGDAEFSRAVLRSAVSLADRCEKMSPALSARTCLLQKHRRQEARAIARKAMATANDDSSLDYVELLVVLGRSSSTDDEAIGYLDEAIGVCRRISTMAQGREAGWIDLHARAKVACGIACKKNHPTRARGHLSDAVALWRSIGNGLAAAVAEIQLLVLDKGPPLKRHQRERLDRESPAVRVAVLRGYGPGKVASSGVLSLREELSDDTLERLIMQAKSA